MDGLTVGCLYLPNGNPAPGPKLNYKLRWLDRLITYGQELLKDGVPSVLCGDFNVVPTPIDAVVPRRWLGDAVYFPESRQAYAAMLVNWWIDAVRRVHPEKGIYTYWNFSYRGGYDRSSGAVDGFHLERVVDRRHQAVRRDRLDDEVEGARPHRPHHRLDALRRTTSSPAPQSLNGSVAPAWTSRSAAGRSRVTMRRPG